MLAVLCRVCLLLIDVSPCYIARRSFAIVARETRLYQTPPWKIDRFKMKFINTASETNHCAMQLPHRRDAISFFSIFSLSVSLFFFYLQISFMRGFSLVKGKVITILRLGEAIFQFN